MTLHALCINQQSAVKTPPTAAQFTLWVNCAITRHGHNLKKHLKNITIVLVDMEQSQALNHQYRNKDKPTNVLSFNYDSGQEIHNDDNLGELIFCANLVANEAQQQNKDVESHWAHLTIHGTLHLLGYDHEDENDAAMMQALEIKALSALGYNNPYEE